MEKIYKGYELMWAVAKGLLGTTQKVSTTNREYMNCTIAFILKDKAENIMYLDFVLIKNNMDNIKEVEVVKNIERIEPFELAGSNVKFNDIFIPTENIINDMIFDKINELVRAVNQIKKED